MVAVIMVRVDAAASDPAVPKRIDGGVTATTPESLIATILECVPVKIVISFIVLEDERDHYLYRNAFEVIGISHISRKKA